MHKTLDTFTSFIPVISSQEIYIPCEVLQGMYMLKREDCSALEQSFVLYLWS
jgi:hypothetical protein